MVRIRSNNKGMTLIEVIVSIAILGIIVIPVTTIFVQALNTASLSDKKLAATGLAQRYLEAKKNGTDPVAMNGEVVEGNKVTVPGTGSFYIACVEEDYVVEDYGANDSDNKITLTRITISVSVHPDGTGLLVELVGLR